MGRPRHPLAAPILLGVVARSERSAAGRGGGGQEGRGSTGAPHRAAEAHGLFPFGFMVAPPNLFTQLSPVTTASGGAGGVGRGESHTWTPSRGRPDPPRDAWPRPTSAPRGSGGAGPTNPAFTRNAGSDRRRRAARAAPRRALGDTATRVAPVHRRTHRANVKCNQKKRKFYAAEAALTNCALSRSDRGGARPRAPKPETMSPGVARPAGQAFAAAVLRDAAGGPGADVGAAEARVVFQVAVARWAPGPELGGEVR